MDNIFQYAFMQRAFVVAAIIAVIAPCIGVSIVLKRLSAIGDATSHSALAGIAFGLLLGINPILGAVMFSIFAVIGIEVFRKSFGKYSEIATVVVMSAGIGLTAVLSGFITNGSTNINSFLFGSIVAINDFELYLTIGLGIAVIITSILLYKELFFVTFDEEAAKLAGVPVGGINLVVLDVLCENLCSLCHVCDRHSKECFNGFLVASIECVTVVVCLGDVIGQKTLLRNFQNFVLC